MLIPIPKSTRMLTFYKKSFFITEIQEFRSSFVVEISTHSSLLIDQMGFNVPLTNSPILMALDLRYIIKFFFNDSHKAVNFLISS
jgi:hypothetical protein